MSDKTRPLCAPTYLLIDEPVEGDRRVCEVLRELGQAEIVNITDVRPPRLDVGAAWMLFTGFVKGLSRHREIKAALEGRVRHHPFVGLWSAWRWTGRALGAARNLELLPTSTRTSTFYANDLYCAVAALAAAPATARVIYDSHEVQFHRNRPAGWCRVVAEVGLERMVLDRAIELRVVNHAIADLLRRIHGALPRTSVRYNDFYPHHQFLPPQSDCAITLLYVGKGFRGRMLETLDSPEHELGAAVHVFPLGTKLPRPLSGAHWRIGPVDYEADLLRLVRARRCLMWCCSEPLCLSYVYALPNKFFQAMAVGAPVVATRGTYLADLVETHALGAIYSGKGGIEDILDTARGPAFKTWCRNIAAFRMAVRDGSLKI